jgi:hypothetical protein
MAQHLPPEKVITPLLQWADPVFKGKYFFDVTK